MRLWHYKLIPILDNQRLLGQHRECCALRGNGWGKKHAIVDYIFKHNYYKLFAYHSDVMFEMRKQGYNVDRKWRRTFYRGKHCEPTPSVLADLEPYPEHGEAYLNECKNLLLQKKPDYYKPIFERVDCEILF